MPMNLKYKNILFLERLDGTIKKEIGEIEFQNVNWHLPDIREMKEQEVLEWLKNNENVCKIRLNPVFHDDARMYKNCTLEIFDLFLIETGNFTEITKFRKNEPA
jgi:hypothetical protein